MAKELPGREQLLQKKKDLTKEIESLETLINATNVPVFDMFINEIKEEMKTNITQEDFKTLKTNQKKIESYRRVENIIKNQFDLLERKKQELKRIEEEFENYQTTIFDFLEIEEEEIEPTGFYDSNKQDYNTGDIYRSKEKYGNDFRIFLIKKSSKIEGSFAFISNFSTDEMLMQYPKNREFLNDTEYIGNIFRDKEDQNTAQCLQAIHKKFECKEEKSADEK